MAVTVDLGGLDNFQGSTSLTGHGYMLYDGPHRARHAACLLETSNQPKLRMERARWRQRMQMKFLFEDLPHEANRVTAEEPHPQVPTARWQGHSDYARRGMNNLEATLQDVLAPLPVERVVSWVVQETEGHILGTTVMGQRSGDEHRRSQPDPPSPAQPARPRRQHLPHELPRQPHPDHRGPLALGGLTHLTKAPLTRRLVLGLAAGPRRGHVDLPGPAETDAARERDRRGDRAKPGLPAKSCRRPGALRSRLRPRGPDGRDAPRRTRALEWRARRSPGGTDLHDLPPVQRLLPGTAPTSRDPCATSPCTSRREPAARTPSPASTSTEPAAGGLRLEISLDRRRAKAYLTI